MTLKEFYNRILELGCGDNTHIWVENCRLNGFEDESVWGEGNHFIIMDRICAGNHCMTVKEFCDECRRRGCEDDTTISIFYCDIESLHVHEVAGEPTIFID